MKRNRIILFGLIVALVISSFILGLKRGNGGLHDATNNNYPLLAKRLFIENPSDTRINFSELRTSLNNYFTSNTVKGGMYFEYLPTGTSIRINANQEYHAASLIKLPVAMELYRANELGKLDINEKVTLKQEWLNDGYGTLYQKGAGYELTLEEASRIMLTESDNTALRVILSETTDALPNDERALGALDVEFSLANDDSISIGARSYASFLKCLYFACYDNFEDSQHILELLTQSDFDNRIVAGVGDKSVKIAHKIGVFNTQVQGDCGIVYVPNNNYVICIILEGNDDNQTNSTMADLSKIVYGFISKN